MTLALTGASGWIGKNTLNCFLLQNRELSKIKLFSSKTKNINYPFIDEFTRNYSLKHLKNTKGLKAIIHTAFIRAVLQKEFSYEEYFKLNREISTELICALEKHPSIPVISISSGVAKEYESDSKSIMDNPYGFLKFEEEKKLKELAKTRMVLIFRVYACTGPFLKIPTHYALGQFIQNCLKGENIKINSSSRVYRSYIFLPDLMSLCLKICDSPLPNGFYLIDACTNKVEIEELASIIRNEFDGIEIERPKIIKPSVSYCGEPQNFFKLANKYSHNITPLEEQVKITIRDCITTQKNE
tara:strand:- start:6003 stop:6899 length:897 start_codon:yes stop_codon:yes gene_type:complete